MAPDQWREAPVPTSRSDGRVMQAKPVPCRAEPEANPRVLLRLRRHRAGAKDPLAVGVLFFDRLLTLAEATASWIRVALLSSSP